MVGFGFFLEDSHFCLYVGRLDIGNETPFETRTQPLFKSGHVLGKFIGCGRQSVCGFVERIESVEKFLLGSFLPGYELYVINEQHIHASELAAE